MNLLVALLIIYAVYKLLGKSISPLGLGAKLVWIAVTWLVLRALRIRPMKQFGLIGTLLLFGILWALMTGGFRL
jgi:hypothetical protein